MCSLLPLLGEPEPGQQVGVSRALTCLGHSPPFRLEPQPPAPPSQDLVIDLENKKISLESTVGPFEFFIRCVALCGSLNGPTCLCLFPGCPCSQLLAASRSPFEVPAATAASSIPGCCPMHALAAY